MDELEEKIKTAFQAIPFGEPGNNILDQNVIYSLEISGDKAQAILIITKEYESFIDATTKKIEEALTALDEINQVGIRVVGSFEEIEAEKKNEPPRQQHPAPPKKVSYFQNYDNVILVASGKGGVGKSTVAVNLALALKKLGKTVSLFDADVYGPSLPIMMGARNEIPEIINQKVLPISRFGIEFISMGNLVEEHESLAWRGPMVHQGIQQMLRDSVWPGGDYVVIDLPPGTGDVQISLAQLTEPTGAVVVCTPQDVALLDARKALTLFEKFDIPILGIVENMSSFICPKCGEETPIFGKGGAKDESESQNVSYLGHVPIELDIRLGGDAGLPIVHDKPDSTVSNIFKDIAAKLEKAIDELD